MHNEGTNCQRQRKLWINSKLKGNPLNSKYGASAAATDQTFTSFFNAGKFWCVTQAGTTAAKTNVCALRTGITQAAATTMDKINLLLSETTSRRRPRKICSSRQGRQRESQVVECRPSPKALKRGNREKALHHHHQCSGHPMQPTQRAVNLSSALTQQHTVTLQYGS